MMSGAVRISPQPLIEERLGAEAPRVLLEILRLLELRARIPRYHRDSVNWRTSPVPTPRSWSRRCRISMRR
jgi:hypothetical protein